MKEQTDVLNALGAFLDKDELHGFPIREWTPSQFASLQPEIQHVVSELKKAGVTFASFNDFFVNHWDTLLAALLPNMPQFIYKSCKGKTLDDVDKLTWLQASEVMVAIMKKNLMHVADFFGQMAQLVGNETDTPSKTPSSQS